MFYLRSGLLGLVSMLVMGCGSELKLSVRAAEAEKDQPSTALVRKVELSYHDGAGKEQMRQSIPVLGLSQPVSVKSDLLKELEWDRDGRFEANGYSGDGLLLLRGTAGGDSERDGAVEIVMSRQESNLTVLASPILRRIRLSNVLAPVDFALDALELRKAIGGDGCVRVPEIRVKTDAGVVPALTFESAIKAPLLSFEVLLEEGRGTTKVLGNRHLMPLNGAGDAALDLDSKLFTDLGGGDASRFTVRLYSYQYEGCLRFSLVRELEPLETSFRLEPEYGGPIRAMNVAPFATLSVTNPNSLSVSVRLEGALLPFDGGAPLLAWYSTSNDTTSLDRLTPQTTIHGSFVLGPRESAGISIFMGARALASGISGNMMMNRGLRVRWSVSGESAEGNGKSVLKTIGRLDQVP